MPIRKYRGRASKPKPHPYCREYKRLFDCAKRKGLITFAPPPLSLPSYLSSTDFIAMKTSPGPLIAGSTITNILKPNSYCYKGPYPRPPFSHFARSLDWLRKYSGCGLRPKGSSSRFDGEKKHASTTDFAANHTSQLQDFGTEVTDFLKGPKGIITIVALVVLFVLTKK